MFSDFKFLFSLLLILTGGILYWCYRNYVKLYSGFPQINFVTFVLKCIVTSKIPKDTPIQHFFFQHFIDVCKGFQSEGMCLVWGFEPFLFIYSEEAFKVFSNENTTINKPYIFDVFKEIFENSLLTSRGEVWKKRRKMLNPVFYLPNLKDQVSLINKNGRILVQNLQMHQNEHSLNILEFLEPCAFKNIIEFMDFNPADEKDSCENEVIDIVHKSAEMISHRILHPWMCPRWILYLSSKGRSFLEIVKNAKTVIGKILVRKMEQPFYDKIKNEREIAEICRNSRRTFAQVILQQHEKDPTFTSTDMQGELSGMLSAGFDTVAHAMMWTLFLMGHNPAVQDQVCEELESVMGQDNDVSYDDLQNLNYLECVIKESLRLYTPVPIYGRRTVRDIQCGKYTVPRNTNIAFFPFLMHRDPDIFPDPEKFIPERFLTDNTEKKLITYPFAEGIRNCIGKNFAMMELKIVLAHVIKNFKLASLDSPESIKLQWEVVLGTVEPLRICFTPRQNIPVQG